MRRSSLATAAAGLAVSLLLSVAAYVLFDSLLLFLFVPVVPFLLRSSDAEPATRVCPECGFESRSPEAAYCPRDGTELEER